MAVRVFSVDFGRGKSAGEGPYLLADEVAAVDTAVEGAVVTALAVSGIDAVSGAEAAIEAIETDVKAATALIGTSLGTTGIRVVIDNAASPTQNDIARALDLVKGHIAASNLYPTA